MERRLWRGETRRGGDGDLISESIRLNPTLLPSLRLPGDRPPPPSPQARKQQAAIALSPLFIFKRDAVMSRNCLLGIEIRWYWTWEGGVVLAAIVTWAWDHQGWYKSLWPFVCSVDQPSISISYHLINGASRWRRQDQVINKTSGVGRNLRPNEITVPTRAIAHKMQTILIRMLIMIQINHAGQNWLTAKANAWVILCICICIQSFQEFCLAPSQLPCLGHLRRQYNQAFWLRPRPSPAAVTAAHGIIF